MQLFSAMRLQLSHVGSRTMRQHFYLRSLVFGCCVRDGTCQLMKDKKNWKRFKQILKEETKRYITINITFKNYKELFHQDHCSLESN